jgi:hypothetical protein
MKKKKNTTDRVVQLGYVPVDSGHLMICDPCYAHEGYDWTTMVETIMRASATEKKGGEVLLADVAGTGIVFESGLGDGVYKVTAVIGDVPGWGERIKRVTITLIEGGHD